MLLAVSACVETREKVSLLKRLVLQGGSQRRLFTGNGADDDIVVSSVRAYIAALNKLLVYVSREEQRSAALEAEQQAGEKVLATI